MNYPQTLAWLNSLGRFGMKLGLSRTQALLTAMGDPQDLFQGVHVAGTNGKGSVCAMLAGILQAAGYRVGLMTKPHLISYTERIQVDQQPIRDDDFAALLTELQPIFDRVAAEHGPPTEFEVLTAASLYYFARAGIDLLVCEVGLGGRLDATNVVDLGVDIITNIALDHTQHLGATLELIAAEKAGILKPGSLAITGAQPPALGVIEAEARRQQIPLLRLGHEITYTAIDRDWGGLLVTVTTPSATYPDLRVPVLGLHQAENTSLAVAGVDALRSRGWEVSDGALKNGLAHTRWPGRLDVVDKDPIVLVDGAHNPAGLDRTLTAAAHLRHGKPMVVIFGVMQDKDLPAMLARLREAGVPVIFSGIDWHRAADPSELATAYGDSSQVAATVSQALAMARQQVGKDGMVLVCGSIYLAGEAMTAAAVSRAHPQTAPHARPRR